MKKKKKVCLKWLDIQQMSTFLFFIGESGTGIKCFSGWYPIIPLALCKCVRVNMVTKGWYCRNCSSKGLTKNCTCCKRVGSRESDSLSCVMPPDTHTDTHTHVCFPVCQCPPVQHHRPRAGLCHRRCASRGDATLLAGGWGWRYGFCSDGADCGELLAAGFGNFIQFGPIARGESLVQPGPLPPTPPPPRRSLPPLSLSLPARLALQISLSSARSLCIGNHSSYSQTQLSLSH